MRRLFPLIIISLIVGCSSAAPTPPAPVASIEQPKPESVQGARASQESTPQLRNLPAENLATSNVKNGVIFAKTDFQGVLEKTYVKLLFEDMANANNKFHLYIGDKEGPQPFMWDV